MPPTPAGTIGAIGRPDCEARFGPQIWPGRVYEADGRQSRAQALGVEMFAPAPASDQGSRRALRSPIPSLRARRASVAMVDLGTLLTYRGRLHVVVGVTPVGASPRLLELEDVESGRMRRVEWTDPGIDTSPRRAWDREDPTDEQATD
jgi:hypothetical protein